MVVWLESVFNYMVVPPRSLIHRRGFHTALMPSALYAAAASAAMKQALIETFPHIERQLSAVHRSHTDKSLSEELHRFVASGCAVCNARRCSILFCADIYTGLKLLAALTLEICIVIMSQSCISS